MEKSSAWEYQLGDLLNTLVCHFSRSPHRYLFLLLACLQTYSLDIKVADGYSKFVDEVLPVSQAAKKRWEAARRDYDSAITKVQQLQKEKKPNPPKIQQAEQDRNRLKEVYLQKGEEAFNALLDSNESADFTGLEKISTYFEAYYQVCLGKWLSLQFFSHVFFSQFFKGGYTFLRELHDHELQKYKKYVQEERSKFEQRRYKRPQGEWIPESISGGATSRTRMFCVSYADIIARDNPPGGVPVFLTNAIAELEKRGLDVQGIFRLSPPKPALDALKKQLDAGKEPNLAEIDDLNIISGLIKLFLRELPEPLLTFELYNDFVSVVDNGDDAARTKAVAKILSKLPAPNMALLKKLVRLCVLIEAKKDVNKMTSTNLAVVLCPSILRMQEANPLTMVEDIEKANKLMVLMIGSYKILFDDPNLAVPSSTSAPVLGGSRPAGPPPPSSSPAPPTSNPAPPPTNPAPPPTSNPVPPPTSNPTPPSTNPAPPTTAPQPPPNTALFSSSSPSTNPVPPLSNAPPPSEPAAATAPSPRVIPPGAVSLPGVGGPPPVVQRAPSRPLQGPPPHLASKDPAPGPLPGPIVVPPETPAADASAGASSTPVDSTAAPEEPRRASVRGGIALPGIGAVKMPGLGDPKRPLNATPKVGTPPPNSVSSPALGQQPKTPPTPAARPTPGGPSTSPTQPAQPVATLSAQTTSSPALTTPVVTPAPAVTLPVAAAAPTPAAVAPVAQTPTPVFREMNLEQVKGHYALAKMTVPRDALFGSQFHEMSDALVHFASLVLKPTLGVADAAPLKPLLQRLALGIKNTLAFVKDFSSSLPAELTNRLLAAAKAVQDNVLGTAQAYKALSEGTSDAAANLQEALKNYIVAQYRLEMRFKETMLYDELSVACEHLTSRLDVLVDSFKTSDRATIAIAANNVQHATFKLTALLRSKILDAQESSLREQLTASIDSAERQTAELTETVKTVLFDVSQDPQLSDTIRAGITSLKQTSSRADALSEPLQAQNNLGVKSWPIYSTILEQLTSNISQQSSLPFPSMTKFVAHMTALRDSLSAMQTYTSQTDAITNSFAWLESAMTVGDNLDSLFVVVENTQASLTDDSAKHTLDAFCQSVKSCSTLFKMGCVAQAFGCPTLDGHEAIRCVAPLKDAVFIMFPFLFSFRDVLTLIEGDQ